MADEQEQVPEQENTPQPEVEIPAEEAGANIAEDSPSPQNEPDYDGRIRALEDQYKRAEERNRYLEQTARLMEQERAQYRQQQQPQQGNDLPAELAQLDQTLDPIFTRRLKQVTQPLTDMNARLYDEHDASRFEMYLMRNNPEVFDQDGGIDKVFQEVEAVRQQAAQQYNQWLSRVDAFMYAQGTHRVKEQFNSRREKKTKQVSEEAKRMQQVRAANSGTANTAPRRVPGSDIQAIREKSQRGELLSTDELRKYKEFISNSGISF